MTEQQKDEHKDGPPWDSARVFSSFEEASVFRATCQQNKQLQVKIKKYLNNCLSICQTEETLYFCDGKLPAPAESPRTGR